MHFLASLAAVLLLQDPPRLSSPEPRTIAIDEAFAEASTRLWLREQDGDDRTAKIAHGERAAEPRRVVMDATDFDLASNDSYSDAIYE